MRQATCLKDEVLIKDEVLLTVGCPIFSPILIAKYLFLEFPISIKKYLSINYKRPSND
jgi:hypothetical protein